jgi:hypothetical protein
MARRKHENTQKGNPHALPIMQHVFPRASIARFADSTGVVSLHRLPTDHVRKAKPSDDMFCAKRAWDAKAESGYMKKIEDAFQELASRIIEGKIAKIDHADQRKATEFFALWKWRAIYRDKEMSGEKFNITGNDLTKDQEEMYEKMGVLTTRKDGTMPAHRVYSIQIQGGIMHDMSALSNIGWGIVQAQEGQFIVPDFPAITFIPLTPTLCLCGARDNAVDSGVVLKRNVVDININLKANSKEYYFANDFGQCF